MRENRHYRWLWWFPIGVWTSAIGLDYLITIDADSFPLIAAVWLIGASCGVGNLWSLVSAIHRRNDWLLLMSFFTLIPGAYLVVLPFLIG